MLARRINRTRCADDKGSVSLLMLTTTLVAVMFASALLYLGATICLQQKLTNSADLVALGGANEFLADQPNPCQAAKAVAQQNQVELLHCQVENLSVSVKVGISTNNLIKRVGVATLTARAKAGL